MKKTYERIRQQTLQCQEKIEKLNDEINESLSKVHNSIIGNIYRAEQGLDRSFIKSERGDRDFNDITKNIQKEYGNLRELNVCLLITGGHTKEEVAHILGIGSDYVRVILSKRGIQPSALIRPTELEDLKYKIRVKSDTSR